MFSKPQRVFATNKGIIEAPAQAVWDLLLDWDGILKSWPTPTETKFNILHIDLHGGVDQIPRNRHVHMAGGWTCSEVLFLANHAARRIYYDMAPNGVPGIHNYIATTFVDELGPERCEMGFNSNFDILEDKYDGETMRKHVEKVYDLIMEGYRGYFARQRTGRG